MKLLAPIALISMTGILYAASPTKVNAPVDTIFIPDGFDDNDKVEIVLHGDFPSTCYKQGDAEVNVDAVTKEIEVKATSLHYSDPFCIQSITPFIQTVDVGLLEKGDYNVIYKPNPTVERGFNVKESTTESPDEYLYAPVDNAYIEVDFTSGKQALKLQGYFPYMFIGCMVMKEVRVYTGPEDVVVALPIAEIVDGRACDDQPDDRNYQVTKGLREPFHGEGLLHVRTLNGLSLNRFIDIK